MLFMFPDDRHRCGKYVLLKLVPLAERYFISTILYRVGYVNGKYASAFMNFFSINDWWRHVECDHSFIERQV